MTVNLIRPAPYLTFAAGPWLHRVDIETKDLGGTIGTSLHYAGVYGLGIRCFPVVFYYPGTRHHDRAEEIATQHLSAAVERAEMSSRVDDTDLNRLSECLVAVVQEDGCRLWNPNAREADTWRSPHSPATSP